LQLQMRKLQEKLLRVTWPLNGILVTFSTIFTSYL